jgi:DNA polymerase (family 10)
MGRTATSKKDVIKILEEIAVMLELKGDNPFKSRAYTTGARSLEQFTGDLHETVDEGTLSQIKGIGDALSKKITELVTTGKLVYYEQLRESIPPGLLDMLRIPGLGPKKIRMLHDKLAIETVGELEYACRENRLIELPGFGKKTQDGIMTGIEHLKIYSERHLYGSIIDTAEQLLTGLEKCSFLHASSLAGSIRRCRETVKDIDILAATDHPDKAADFFLSLPEVAVVIERGKTKISVKLASGVSVDLRIVSAENYPYALHHFTGSKEHNVAMRSRAKQRGLKLNEYGLFRASETIPCRSEAELFHALGLAYIPPELREDRGEIEAAERGQLPLLIEEKNIRGLFHVHTDQSDGVDTLESLVAAAKAMGMEYLGIADHSESAFYAGGLDIAAIRRQHEHIDRINAREESFTVFKGIEAEILPDGRLDYDDDTLGRFDFVIAAVHSHFKMPEGEMTMRILTALDNPYVTMLSHPTGRLLLAREPYRVDLVKIIDHAAARGVIIELNANPHRLDLDWRFCRYAVQQGAKIAINPDAHSVQGLNDIRFGINIARKGWVSPDDCINCLDCENIEISYMNH